MEKAIKGIVLVVLFVISIMIGYLYATLHNWGASVEATEDNRMVEVSRTYGSKSYRIYVDKITKVMYLRNGTTFEGVFTLMVDQDGKPLLYEGE